MEIDNIPDLKELDRLTEKYIHDDEVMLISDIVSQVKNKKVDKYKIGFQIFNEALNGGFQDGELVVVSGISGQGKTSFAQTLTFNLTKQGIPCLWFSYEDTLEHLHNKFVNMGIEDHYIAYHPKKIHTGRLDWISYKIREAYIKYACKVVFIDHIDFLVPLETKGKENREEYLKKIAIDLKSLAVELKCVVVVMAHLKKLEDGKEPDLQDIGYSAGIYQNANTVFMVYRERNKRKMGELSGDTYTNNTIIKIVKNRETGQSKFVKCQYVNNKFIELTYEDDTSNFN